MRVTIILILAFILFSCDTEEEIGTCSSYDEEGIFVKCIGRRTESECAKLDVDQHNGYDWRFKMADICPPPSPDQ